MSAANPTTVLIVDDEPAMRSLLEAILEAAEIPTLSAADLSSAKQLLMDNADRIQSCLLDLNLGESTGEQVYDALKSVHPGLAVYPMSGLLDDEIRERFASRPIAGIISKPFRAGELLNALQQGMPER